MRAVLPWGIAVAACGVAAWASTRDRPANGTSAEAHAGPQDPGPLRTSAVESETSPDEPPPLEATRVCVQRLRIAESALRRCRGAAQPTPDSPASADCLDDPDVAAVVERRIEDAVRDHVEAQADVRMRARERERSAFDAWSREALRLSAEESAWLDEYVCAARELRDHTLASLDETPAVQALGELKSQRQDILKDIEVALGPDRYAKLRAIGGIGLIADTTSCD